MSKVNDEIKYDNEKVSCDPEKEVRYVDVIKNKINNLTDEEFKELQQFMWKKADEQCGKVELMRAKCRIISELSLDDIHALDCLEENVIWRINSFLHTAEHTSKECAEIRQELNTVKAITRWDRDYLGIRPNGEQFNECYGEEPVKAKGYVPYRG